MPSLLHKSPPAGSKPSASRTESCGFLSLAMPSCSSLPCVKKTSSPPLALASPKQNRLPLVSSRLHHWLRLPHRCPSLRNRVLSLYHVYKFSSFMLTKRSRNRKVLANRVKQARYTVFSSKMHMNPNLRCFSYHPAAEMAHSRKPSFRRIWFSEAQQIIG